MKKLLLIISVFVSVGAFAQVDSISLLQAVSRLDKALLQKDTATLSVLLDKKLAYGHSNGWIQFKKDMKDDFFTGKINYTKLESTDMRVVAIDKDWATVRFNCTAEGIANGKNFTTSLIVMQVWKKDKKGWQLLARQGAKIPN